MIFTCCHPALAPEARMALTLRSVAGLTVPEIARAFLSSEDAMERRLTRARRKVTDARIPFRVPPDDAAARAARRRAARRSTSSTPRATAAVRGDLCEEAIRLARLLARLMPDEAEVLGLLALLLRDRRAAGGARARRRRARLARGAGPQRAGTRSGSPRARRCSSARCGSGAPGRTSSRRRSPRCTRRRRPGRRPTGRRSPACTPSSSGSTRRRSSRSTAPSRSRSPTARTAGLAILDELECDPRLDRYQPLHAARAELLRRAGDADAADAAYARAIALADSDAERAALERRRDRG